MNCARAERMILLASSGELSARRAARLERHVAQCARCRAFRADAHALPALARDGAAAGAPAAATLARIRAAAAAPAPAAAGLRPAFQAFAMAAALAIAAGGWLLWASARGADHAGHLSGLLAIVAEDGAEAAEEPAAAASRDERLRAMAAQILRMEGLTEEEAPEPFPSAPDPEQEPTATRSRSTAAPPPGRCV